MLWTFLEKLEELVYDEHENLKIASEKELHDDIIRKPLKGLNHVFQKLRNEDDLTPEDLKCLENFIDGFTTVSINPNIVGEDVVKIVLEVNVHHHTKTCRKYDSSCRFNYPRFPTPKTIVAKPLKGKKEDVQKMMNNFNEILQKVSKILEEKEVIEEIMLSYLKQNEEKSEHPKFIEERVRKICVIADVKYEEYISAISTSNHGYKVVLRRDIDELFVNSFNIEWIRAWNGNLDIQICLDFFAVITYITDYYSKDDSGTLKLITEALKQDQSSQLKDQMKIVANSFLKNRSMGEAEAIYKLIPDMRLKGSNVTCQWVSLSTKEEKSSRFRKATENQLKSGIDAFKLDGHDGLFYETQDIWSKYLRRPEEIKDLCFAQFAKMYRTNKIDDEDNYEDDIEDTDESIKEKKIEYFSKFNYIMTFENLGSKGMELPKKIELKNLYPGEPKLMKRRTYPAALRYHKLHAANEPIKFMLSEIMLYVPLTEEVPLEMVNEIYNDSYEKVKKVDLVKKQVMEYLEDVTEARYFVEEVMKELDIEKVGIVMDPNLAQINADCEAEEFGDHPEFQHIDPDLLDNYEKVNSKSIYKNIEIKCLKTLQENTRSLDVYQRKVVDIGIKYSKDIVKSRKNCSKQPDPIYLMVHGGAGAGKSTVINVLAQWVQKILEKEGNIPLFTSIFLKFPSIFHNFPQLTSNCQTKLSNKIAKLNYQTKLSSKKKYKNKIGVFSKIALNFAHIFPHYCPQFLLILH